MIFYILVSKKFLNLSIIITFLKAFEIDGVKKY